MSVTDQRPRHYAQEIADMESRAERLAALDRVPADWRGLVERHVRIMFERRRNG